MTTTRAKQKVKQRPDLNAHRHTRTDDTGFVPTHVAAVRLLADLIDCKAEQGQTALLGSLTSQEIRDAADLADRISRTLWNEAAKTRHRNNIPTKKARKQ